MAIIRRIDVLAGKFEDIAADARAHPKHEFWAIEPKEIYAKEALAENPLITKLKNLNITQGISCDEALARLSQAGHKARLITLRVPSKDYGIHKLLAAAKPLLVPKGKVIWTDEISRDRVDYALMILRGTVPQFLPKNDEEAIARCEELAERLGYTYCYMGNTKPRTDFEKWLTTPGNHASWDNISRHKFTLKQA